MKLYSLTFSPNGRKAESLIAHLGLDVEVHQTDMAGGEHKSPEFLAKNPMGKIPLLDDNGFSVWESNVIMTYLAAQKPEKNLVPTDLKERTEVDKWLHWQSAHQAAAAYRLVTELVLKKMYNAGPPDEAVVQAMREELKGYTALLEKQLEGKDFVCGSLTVVDFALGAWAEILPMLGVDYADFPNVRGWLDRCHALDGWVNSPPMG